MIYFEFTSVKAVTSYLDFFLMCVCSLWKRLSFLHWITFAHFQGSPEYICVGPFLGFLFSSLDIFILSPILWCHLITIVYRKSSLSLLSCITTVFFSLFSLLLVDFCRTMFKFLSHILLCTVDPWTIKELKGPMQSKICVLFLTTPKLNSLPLTKSSRIT